MKIPRVRSLPVLAAMPFPSIRTATMGAASLAVAAFAIAAFASAALADEGIVVRGDGSATARPTQIEISATLNGDAPLAADALVKFRDAKKRAFAAIAGLKNPDLSIEPGGVSVGGGGSDANTQMMIMRGMTPPNNSQSVRLSETSRIVLAHADKLDPDELLEKVLKILDVAKDAGFQMGTPSATNILEMQMMGREGGGNSATVSFKLPDSVAVRERAYKAAIDDAKAKAQQLARLSGAKLGRIVSVRDDPSSKTESNTSLVNLIYGIGNTSKESPPTDKSITGSNTGDLTLRVSLEVQFEIVK
ncbi:MAG TPA: SIMPL domain-containing protein [Pirellulales bacterium]|nr:SIMPL domain-containing protein [Pirellulales bacterium]